jgi:hypothetical protein
MIRRGRIVEILHGVKDKNTNINSFSIRFDAQILIFVIMGMSSND